MKEIIIKENITEYQKGLCFIEDLSKIVQESNNNCAIETNGNIMSIIFSSLNFTAQTFPGIQWGGTDKYQVGNWDDNILIVNPYQSYKINTITLIDEKENEIEKIEVIDTCNFLLG